MCCSCGNPRLNPRHISLRAGREILLTHLVTSSYPFASSPLGEYRQDCCCTQAWPAMPRAQKCELKQVWKALPWMNRGPGSLISERQLRECSSFGSSRQMPGEKKMWLLTLNLSAKANAREGEELFKVKDNVGLRTNKCNLAMNKFRLKIRKEFLTIRGVSSQLFNRNSRNPIPIQSNLIRLLKRCLW